MYLVFGKHKIRGDQPQRSRDKFSQPSLLKMRKRFLEELETFRQSIAVAQERHLSAQQQFKERLRSSLHEHNVEQDLVERLFADAVGPHDDVAERLASLSLSSTTSGPTDSFISNWQQSGELLATLKESATGALKEVLNTIERKRLSLELVTARECHELSHSDKADIVQTLLRCLEELDMVSTRRDSTVVLQLLRDIKRIASDSDTAFPLVICTIEDKVSSRQALTRTQVKLLRANMAERLPDVLRLLENKLCALDIMPLETKDSDEDHEVGMEAEAEGDCTPLSALTADEAVQLLIHHGCCVDLHDRVSALSNVVVNGTFLNNIDCVEALLELEGSDSGIRRTQLNVVLRRLYATQTNGVSESTLSVIRADIQARGRGRVSKAKRDHRKAKNDSSPPPPAVAPAAASESVAGTKPPPPPPATSSSTFKATNDTLPGAVVLWCTDRPKALQRYGHISAWDTSEVTSMKLLFHDRKEFNDNISAWDVSKVTDMSGMFRGASSFNQPLNNWDVRRVTLMGSMFSGASAFNRSLNHWSVGKVTDMGNMFWSASKFNQPLDSWDVRRVTSMTNMFALAEVFDQSLQSWDVGSVTNISHMFMHARAFNQPLDGWNVHNVYNLASVFYGATAFNQPLNSWNTRSVTHISHMFCEASSFNQPLDQWDTRNITTMERMFCKAHAFNQPIGNWNVTNVSNMNDMFDGATRFSYLSELKQKWPQLTSRKK